jgi:ABC-type uncharacterized transport system fused permease/ATPase subunit
LTVWSRGQVRSLGAGPDGLLRERLPGATMVSIAQKPSVIAFHDRRLPIDPIAWRLRMEPVALTR